MKSSKTTQSRLTGATPTEGYLRSKAIWFDHKFQSDVRPHNFEAFGWLLEGFKCTFCGWKVVFKEGRVRDGHCNMFHHPDDRAWILDDTHKDVRINTVDNGEKAKKGLTIIYNEDKTKILDAIPYVWYPKTGKAWQQDKVLNERKK